MNETLRPSYHFTPVAGWMNDPNGLVIYQQEMHLFYQALPPGTQGKHWGHAVSTDGVSWQHLPIALAPDALGEIWSGSAVADRGNTSGFFAGQAEGGLVAIFTHASVSAQVQSLAYSLDRGRTWTKYSGNPVLTSTSRDFRDPKVFWHVARQRWTMIVAVGDHVEIYASPDLKTWTFVGEFGRDRLMDCEFWECPDLVLLQASGDGRRERWALTASFLGPGEPAGRCETRYWLGSFDGERFEADETQPWIGTLLDHGPDNYASVTWDGDYLQTTRNSIGWMSRWAYADKTPTVGWQGAMTIPRVLWVKDEGGKLLQVPSGALTKLRRMERGISPAPAGPGTFPLDADTGEAFEFITRLRCDTEGRCGFRLRASRDGTVATEVGYDPTTGRLYLDRTRSGEVGFHRGFPGTYDAAVELGADRELRLQIFVDRCSVEVFAQDGEVVLTALIFPPTDAQRLEFFAEGRQSKMTPSVSALYLLRPAQTEGDPDP